MGVREKLSGNSQLGLGLALLTLVIGVGLIGVQLFGGRRSAVEKVSSTAFYTDDNGHTFFKDDARKFVPFDRNGKKVYRADVFRGPDNKEFVGLLYRHNPASHAEMDRLYSGQVKDPNGLKRREAESRVMEVKPVGASDTAWVIAEDPTVDSLRANVHTPSGQPVTLVQP